MTTYTILMVCPFFSPNIGGVETHLDDLCRHLQDRDRDVQVITYQPLTTRARGAKNEARGTVSIRRLSWFGYNWFLKLEPYPLLEFIYLFPALFFHSFLYLFRHRKRVQVIHAHGLIAGAVGALLAKLFRKRAVLSTHTIYALPQRRAVATIARAILNSFDRILCLSQESKKELINIGIDPTKIIVYTYWVDQEVFKPFNKENYKKQFGWDNKFVALFVGRLISVKGVALLLEAARVLTDKDIYFVFAGNGPLAGKVKEAARSQPNVVFLGPLDSRLLVPYYNAADVLVVPSVSEEGFGRVIVEALSCGTPVIASRRGGIPEAVTESVGILIEPNSTELKQAINKIHANSTTLSEMRKNCRSYAEQRFSSKNAEVILESYE